MNSSSIKELLHSINICSRCILRYSVESAKQVFESDEVSCFVGCGACLGVLSDESLKAVVLLIVDQLKQYEASLFTLAITLPQCIFLRQSSLSAFIKQNIKQENLKHLNLMCLSIKESLKFRVIQQVEVLSLKKHCSKSTILVNLVYHHETNKVDLSKIPNKTSKKKFSNKNKCSEPEVSNQVMENFLRNLKESDISKYITCPPSSVTSLSTCNVTVCQESIFIAGRYNKYSRELSQTPWIIEGERKTDLSVQDLICNKMQEKVLASEKKFISSGREDVDVLMLGKGRPFAVELINPKRSGLARNEVYELQEAINSSTDLIAVRDLQVMRSDVIQKLKEGEEEKKKLYRARIWCPFPIPAQNIAAVCTMKNILLLQKTPIRVLHRRPLISRERTVYEINITPVDDFHYDVFVTTQAGTYVKEFVHGDFGRTYPSLRTLLNAEVDILELDVQNVEFDWPPSFNDDTVT